MKTSLQKWEFSLQQKIHNNKIRNARPTMRKGGRPASSQIHLEEPVTQTSLYKLLKSYSLQQYTKKLLDMELDLSNLASRSDEELSFIFEAIKILPGHRSRFESAIDCIRSLMCRGDIP